MRRTLLTLTLLLLAGCGGEDVTTAAPVTLCDGPEGTWTDLSTEPEWWRDGIPERAVNWTDEAGCAVNGQYVFHDFGDEHCGWENVEFLSIGVPIGTPYSGPDADPPGEDWEPRYFHNADGGVEGYAPAETLGELPATATDTGLRAAGDRLMWAEPDASRIYVQRGDDVQVFVPVDDDEVGCA